MTSTYRTSAYRTSKYNTLKIYLDITGDYKKPDVIEFSPSMLEEKPSIKTNIIYLSKSVKYTLKMFKRFDVLKNPLPHFTSLDAFKTLERKFKIWTRKNSPTSRSTVRRDEGSNQQLRELANETWQANKPPTFTADSLKKLRYEVRVELYNYRSLHPATQITPKDVEDALKYTEQQNYKGHLSIPCDTIRDADDKIDCMQQNAKFLMDLLFKKNKKIWLSVSGKPTMYYIAKMYIHNIGVKSSGREETGVVSLTVLNKDKPPGSIENREVGCKDKRKSIQQMLIDMKIITPDIYSETDTTKKMTASVKKIRNETFRKQYSDINTLIRETKYNIQNIEYGMRYGRTSRENLAKQTADYRKLTKKLEKLNTMRNKIKTGMRDHGISVDSYSRGYSSMGYLGRGSPWGSSWGGGGRVCKRTYSPTMKKRYNTTMKKKYSPTMKKRYSTTMKRSAPRKIKQSATRKRR